MGSGSALALGHRLADARDTHLAAWASAALRVNGLRSSATSADGH